MGAIAENLLVMILSLVVVLGGFYLLLVLLDAWLKLKRGSREQEGLTALWLSTHQKCPEDWLEEDAVGAEKESPPQPEEPSKGSS